MRATESAFGHLAVWHALHRLLERADVPLRTVELVYAAAGSGLLAGIVFAVAGAPGFVTLLAMVVGGVGADRRRLVQGEAPADGDRRPAARPAGHARRLAEGRPQLPPGDPGRRRRGPAAREQGVQARARPRRGSAGPMDDALAEMAERVGSKNLSLRRHRGDDPAPGRRQPRRHLRHGRRGGPEAAAVRAQDPVADGDGPCRPPTSSSASRSSCSARSR